MKLIVIGSLLLVPWLLSYIGAWRSWSNSTVLHWPFGLAWAGVGLALCVLGIVFAFWLPQFLLPRWCREAKPSARRRRAGR